MKPRSTKRGICPVCGYSIKLNKDGAIQGHHLFSLDAKPHVCDGSWQEPKPTGDANA